MNTPLVSWPRMAAGLAATTALVFCTAAAPEPPASSVPAELPTFQEVPDASTSLTEVSAQNLMQVERVQLSASTFHIPMWSQCAYSGQGVSGRVVGTTFKFMLAEMFDVANLPKEQLEFNTSFATGGTTTRERLDDLGLASFVFVEKDRTTLLVLTGIHGPLDGAERPQVMNALYYLANPDQAAETRRDVLIGVARGDLETWYGSASAPE